MQILCTTQCSAASAASASALFPSLAHMFNAFLLRFAFAFAFAFALVAFVCTAADMTIHDMTMPAGLRHEAQDDRFDRRHAAARRCERCVDVDEKEPIDVHVHR